MPTELETARRIFAGELAHAIEQYGVDIIPDALAMLEEQTRTDFITAYSHCNSMAALEPIRTSESLARILRESVAMYVLVGKHDLGKVIRPHAARYRRKARAALRRWKPAYPYEKQPVLEL
jgi:hypothetical protein